MAVQGSGGEREQPQVSGEVHIGGDVNVSGGAVEIAGVIQKFGTQPRTLTGKDVEAAVAYLAQYPRTPVMIGPASGSPDGAQLAAAIRNLLQKAKWETGQIGTIGAAASEGSLSSGVLIDYEWAPDREPLEALCRALNDLGIQASLTTGWGIPPFGEGSAGGTIIVSY